MRRTAALLLALLFVLAIAPRGAMASSALSADEYAQGEALALCESSAFQSLSRSGSLNAASPSPVSVLSVWDMRPESGLNTATESAGASVSIVRFGSSMDTASLVSYLKGQPSVVAAEPNYIYHTDSISNDPYVDAQWGLSGANGVHPQSLWTQPSVSSIVAVIDTGIDYNSPDLQGRIAESLAFDAYPTGGSVGSDTGSQGHGTHVAGIIAAATNNSVGGAGVTGEMDCKIMPVRVFNGSTAYASDVVAGIAHVIQKKNTGNNIVAANMSIGGKWFSSEIMRYALGQLAASDILPVRSAGNDSLYVDDNSVYPSIFETPGTVSVAAIDASGAFDASYSNYSDACVHVAAPGTDILSTWFKGRGGYVGSSGSLKFDGFENNDLYTIKYTPRTWSSGLVESDAVIINTPPQSGGYASAQSLQFSIQPFSSYNDFRVLLPNSDGVLRGGQSLGLRIRFSSSSPLAEYNLPCAAIGERDVKPSRMSQCALNKWYYLYGGRDTDGELSLWLSLFDASANITVYIDDLGSSSAANTAYNVFEGTSCAAPFFTGAYALMRAVYPGKTMAELRARLIGGSRSDASLNGRVNAGGSVDLAIAALDDTSSFAPVIDEITQSGSTVTVKGWFFSDTPTLSLGGAPVFASSQTGSANACTLTFELPSSVSGVQTLTLTKSNGRSFRMRYDYSPKGNMTVIGPLPEAPNGDVVLRDVFSYGGGLYYLVSTADGFSVCVYENGAYSSFISKDSAGDRAARDDFSTFVDNGVLYIYDFTHIHRFDMSSRVWLPDIASPCALDASKGFYTGAVAVYNGKLMLIGGKGGGLSQSQEGRVSIYENGTWTDEGIVTGSFALHSARAISINGRLIVFARDTANSFSNKYAIFVYDGQSWTKRACPYTDLCSASLAALDNEMILCFGDSKSADGILAYNVSTDSWRRLPYWGEGLAYTARGAVTSSRIFTITGLQASRDYLLQYVELRGGGEASSSASTEYFAPRKHTVELRGSLFTSPDSDLSKAVGVFLGSDSLQPGRDYTLSDNGFYLSDSLLSRLTDGEYTLRVLFADGQCELVFHVSNGRIVSSYAALPATGEACAAFPFLFAALICFLPKACIKKRLRKTAAVEGK